MTRNQIDYQNLLLTKQRDQVNAAIGFGNLEESVRHNKAAESETARHNKVAEDQAFKQLVINQGMLDVNKQNADTNRLNYYVNKQNADTNQRNAETNRLNYYVNVENAHSNRISANAAAANAQASMLNAQANMAMIPVAEYNAKTNRMQANIASRQADAAMYNATTNRMQASNAKRQADAAMIRAQNDTYRYHIEQERAKVQNAFDESRTGLNLLQAQFYPDEAKARIENLNSESNYKQVATSLLPGNYARGWIDSMFQGAAALGKSGLLAGMQ